jgi:hypothetical protein
VRSNYDRIDSVSGLRNSTSGGPTYIELLTDTDDETVLDRSGEVDHLNTWMSV